MLPDGNSIKTDRRKCFAPADPTESPYPQRWYYSHDCKVAIRLPRNEIGERQGKDTPAFPPTVKSNRQATKHRLIIIPIISNLVMTGNL